MIDVLLSCLAEFRESPDWVLEQIEGDMRPCQKIADWRNYIPHEVAVVWHELSVETRVVAYLMARQQTSCEG